MNHFFGTLLEDVLHQNERGKKSKHETQETGAPTHEKCWKSLDDVKGGLKATVLQQA